MSHRTKFINKKRKKPKLKNSFTLTFIEDDNVSLRRVLKEWATNINIDNKETKQKW